MVTSFSCVVTIRSWHGKEIALGLLQNDLYEALTNWQKLRWIDLYDPEKFSIKLWQGAYIATFRFPVRSFTEGRDEIIPFIHSVSVLRNGNPFRFRSAKFDQISKEWLQHALSGMSVKNQNKHCPYQRIHAEQHIRQLVENGYVDKYGL